MPISNSIDVVYETCLLLVTHFRNLIQHGKPVSTQESFDMLHPEKEFVYAGKSEKVGTDTPTHPEHVVPCAKLITECQRLIREGKHSDEQDRVVTSKALESSDDYERRTKAFGFSFRV